MNWFVDREKERQQGPDMVATERSRHGYEPSSGADEDLARFLREVDSSLPQVHTRSPLVELGDDDLVARFSKYGECSTMRPDNSGMPATISPSEVHPRVLSVITDLDRRRIEEAMDRARDRLGHGLGTTDLEGVLVAAVPGPIEAVILDRGAAPQWGRLDQITL